MKKVLIISIKLVWMVVTTIYTAPSLGASEMGFAVVGGSEGHITITGDSNENIITYFELYNNNSNQVAIAIETVAKCNLVITAINAQGKTKSTLIEEQVEPGRHVFYASKDRIPSDIAAIQIAYSGGGKLIKPYQMSPIEEIVRE